MIRDFERVKTQALYKRAKQIIPGGTQLFSKRPELFVPEQWPAYYSRASGCSIWDLDGNQYMDMSTMGIGTCVLGYADPEVNRAVIDIVRNGSMSSLNTYLEVKLAEILLKFHPWAEMVRFARTGGEIMTVAIRIARAYSGRDGIAFCGYHGWHDWYLAANLVDNSKLDEHLLSGLLPNGVPKSLKGTIFPFGYNRVDELRNILESQGEKIGTIVMEPLRYQEPRDNFLEEVRRLATKCGCVLIFDEITSGWRHSIGGVHLELGIEPDIAVFAKALGNGFPIAAVIGKANVMDKAQESFISSTYWTEAVGPAAALATVEKMERIDLPRKLEEVGKEVKHIWEFVSSKYGLKVNIEGRFALMHFRFELSSNSSDEGSAVEEERRALNTLFSQEMLRQGFLAGTSFYASYAHYVNRDMILERYENALESTFSILSSAVAKGRVWDFLTGPVAVSSFGRLT